MLDKLVANAVEFSTGGAISIRLERDQDDARLAIANEGPPLPPEIADRLFDSMVSARSERSANDTREPHLGLGLYIVRLVAEFHGARARAVNRADGSGVEVIVTMPIAT